MLLPSIAYVLIQSPQVSAKNMSVFMSNYVDNSMAASHSALVSL